MKKQKIKLVISFLVNLIAGLAFVGQASASGSATVSWVAPADSDLAGYRIYYKTTDFDCAAWNSAPQDGIAGVGRKNDTGQLLPATKVNVPDPTKIKTKYAFTDVIMLAPGSTNYFALVAYDTSGNLSDCSADSGTSAASKTVTYPADISSAACISGTHCVNGGDYSLLHAAYDISTPKPGNTADINADTYVNGADYSILHAEYGLYF